MARHFTYKHLPASGLGHRDPRRPHVTGGLGLGLPSYITDIIEKRIYEGRGRDTMVANRSLLNEARNLIVSNRHYAEGVEMVPIRVNPSSDIIASGFYDDEGGNDNGEMWDELAGAGYVHGWVTKSYGIPGIPLFGYITLIVQLPVIDDPKTDRDHYVVMKARGLREVAPGFGLLGQVLLYDDNAQITIARWEDIQSADDGWVEFKLELTESEAALLTYQSMWLAVRIDLASDPFNYGPERIDIDSLRLEVPSYISRVSRYRNRLDRILAGIGRTLSAMGRRYGGGGRDMGSGGRDLE